MQKIKTINNIKIPVIFEDEVIYYPITYTYKKVLLKVATPSSLVKNGYSSYIKQFEIKFGEKNTQKAYCISEEGLKLVLLNVNINRLDSDQKLAMKKMCQYLKLKNNIEINTDEKFVKEFTGWREYDDYWIKECIESLLENEEVKLWQRCNKCGLYLPYHTNFFKIEGRTNGKRLTTLCRQCTTWDNDHIRHSNEEIEQVYRKYGKEIYEFIKNKDIVNVWKWWINQNSNKHKPKILNDKDNFLILLKYLYDNNELTEDDISNKRIYEITKIKINNIGLDLKEVYKEVLGIDIKSKDGYGINNFQDAKSVFENYLNKNKLSINEDNVYTFDYWTVIKQSGLTGFIKKYFENDLLKFILELNNYNLIPYKFKFYVRHWQTKKNRVYALKCLIEKDFKLKKEKIPLYLTLHNIKKRSDTMYNVLVKYYQKDIWKWVNELYPDEFEEQDFNIGKIRTQFDSQEECEIHDYLKSKFKNVFYNQRNSDNTINIKGMYPDWFIFTDNGLWVVEYFGQYVENRNNKRVNDYRERVEEKLDKYDTINWFNKIYIYPEDLKNEYENMKIKLAVIN